MKNNGNKKVFVCYFCNSKNSLFQITNEINDILFKTNFSNLQSHIYLNLKQILMNIPKEEEKILCVCENCLTKIMNFHFFGIEDIQTNIMYDFIDNSRTANLSFLQLMESYKTLSRNILECNYQIFKDMKNLFDFIYSNSQVFYTQFGNKTSFMIIDQIYSLINILRESINNNNNSNNLEASFLTEINNYIEKMFRTIDFYKMINNPYIEFISSHFDYSKFLNYQSVNNYNEYVEKNKKILLELTNNINSFNK